MSAEHEPRSLMAPRIVLMKDGRTTLIRPIAMSDSDASNELKRRIHEARVGVVRSIDQAAQESDAVEKEIRKWVDGVHSGEEGFWPVAEVAGSLSGAARIARERFARLRHVAHLSIGIDPDFQGLGLGRALMIALIDWAIATRTPGLAGAPGVNRLTLDVFANNTRAIRLYESLGFVVEGTRRRHIREPDGTEGDDLMMALLLDEAAGNTQ